MPAVDVLALAGHRRTPSAGLPSLPLAHRAHLVSTTFSGYTHAEVGRILGISEGAAEVRAHRARRDLAVLLQGWVLDQIADGASAAEHQRNCPHRCATSAGLKSCGRPSGRSPWRPCTLLPGCCRR